MDIRQYIESLPKTKPVDIDECLVMYADIPERYDVNIFLSLVTMWQGYVAEYKKPLRLFTYLYDTNVENKIQTILNGYTDIQLTVIPGYLRKG